MLISMLLHVRKRHTPHSGQMLFKMNVMPFRYDGLDRNLFLVDFVGLLPLKTWDYSCTTASLLVTDGIDPCLLFARMPCQNYSQRPPAQKTGKGSLLNRPSCPVHDDPVGQGSEWATFCCSKSCSPNGPTREITAVVLSSHSFVSIFFCVDWIILI